MALVEHPPLDDMDPAEKQLALMKPEATVAIASRTENFRTNNVRFLQEQNRQALMALGKVEEERDEALHTIKQWETQQLEDAKQFADIQIELERLEGHSSKSRSDLLAKDEHVRVLSEQNRQLLSMLEGEEQAGKEAATESEILKIENDRLQIVSREFESMKDSGEQQVISANNEIIKLQDSWKGLHQEEEQTGAAVQNYFAQAKVDIEALEDGLAEAKKANAAHLQQIQHNEVQEHRMIEDLHSLKDTMEELLLQKQSIKSYYEGDQSQRNRWMKSKGEVIKRLENLETTADELRKTLQNTENANSKMSDDNRKAAEKFREMGDKVYALMDQLRLNQVEMKKQEQDLKEKQKRIIACDKQLANLEQKHSVEVDSRQQSDTDMRNASQMLALLQKKNKKLIDTLSLCIKAQEKAEKRAQELTDKSNALQSQNAYLASRVDGQEDDKSALRTELKKQNDDIKAASLTYQNLAAHLRELEDKNAETEALKAAYSAELEYIRREDMLDETGRTKPILIEATDSRLAERLQVNEFLFQAQQVKNPIPMLVEKVSHFLELLHTAEVQSDTYLQDLQRSNGMLAAMREKNLNLYEKTQQCETWKMRALMKMVSNAFEPRQTRAGLITSTSSNLYLDGLNYSKKEIEEFIRLLKSYEKEDTVQILRMQENGFTDDKIYLLIQLIDTLPYLHTFDLRKNRFTDEGIFQFQNHLAEMQGVTSTERDEIEIRARSGPQLRLRILVAEQSPHNSSSTMPSEHVTADLSVVAADEFLQTAGGVLPVPGSTVLEKSQEAREKNEAMEQRSLAKAQAKSNFRTGESPDLNISSSTPHLPSASNVQFDITGQSKGIASNSQDALRTLGYEGVGNFGGIPIGLGGAGDAGRLGVEKLPQIAPKNRAKK